MIAAVTGATGFLGRYLVEDLLEIYDEVRILARMPEKIDQEIGLNIIQGDITQPETLNEKFLGNIDCLFHGAAKVDNWPKDPKQGYEQVNVDGTRNIINQADKFDVPKIVYTSSYFALGPTGSLPRDEKWDVKPDFNHPYVRTKYQAGKVVDELIQLYAHPIIQVHPTTIMGEGIDNVLSTILIDWINGTLIGLPGGGGTELNFVAASDVALGHVLAAENGEFGEKYILGGQNMSLRAFMDLFGVRLGISIPRSLPFFLGKLYAWFLELKGSPELTRADIAIAQKSFVYSIEKATVELGYEPQSIDNVIDSMLKSFVQTNKLNSRGEERVNNYFSTNF